MTWTLNYMYVFDMNCSVYTRMEEEMYWEERRRYEELEYYEWQRQGRPGMPPPRPFPHGPGGPMVINIILFFLYVIFLEITCIHFAFCAHTGFRL